MSKGFVAPGRAVHGFGGAHPDSAVRCLSLSRLTTLRPSGADAPALDEIVRRGLGSAPKWLPPCLFYDSTGSELFHTITRLPEYYLTRTEAAILRRHADEFIPPGADTLVEFGPGSAEKTRTLLDAATRQGAWPLHYIAVDVSEAALSVAAHHLLDSYPSLRITAVAAEFSRALPALTLPPTSLILFLGSSIGNFDHRQAVEFLRSLRSARIPLLIGFDMQKDPALLHAAYNDSAGVTAAFNKNVLVRLNRELGADFDIHAFDHKAFYNEPEGRIEMHLASRRPQRVRVGPMRFRFEAGETIHTENSYKYTPALIETLARQGGFAVDRAWRDDAGWFSLVRLAPA